jgi:phosphoribosylformylglycinamidine synthase
MRNDKNVKVIVLRTAGTNCDQETVFAFRTFGAQVDLVHVNRLLEGTARLADYHMLAIPGGFTYGDDIAAGRILANELRLKLGKDIHEFIRAGKPIIGICNGFQVLVKSGFLPGLAQETSGDSFLQEATLTNNDSGKFEDRWIHLKITGRSIWTENLKEVIFLPVAHGEGKFVPQNETVRQQLNQNVQIVFRYCHPSGRAPSYPDNPNGSVDDIAGITDPSGRILGLMPHPERHLFSTQHPYWTRLPKRNTYGDGAKIFENGIRYVQEHLL